MNVRVGKRTGNSAAVRIPSSKSLSHRALIAASLAPGVSVIRNLVYNNDTEATMRALGCLGARFKQTEDALLVEGVPFRRRSDLYRAGEIDAAAADSL